MRVIVYGANAIEKNYLQAANRDQHELQFCNEELNELTAELAENFDVVVVSGQDIVSSAVIKKLRDLNVQFISIRAQNFKNVDIDSAQSAGIRVANIPVYKKPPLFVKDLLSHVAAATLDNINCWAKNQNSLNELTDPDPGRCGKKEILL